VGIRSLIVQGRAALLAGGGHWSAPVSLRLGANKITATLTGQDGDTSRQQITVTRSPLTVHKLRVSARRVRLGVTCGSGSVCRGTGQVLTVERLLGQQIVGLQASKTTLRRRRVVLGSERFSVRAGKTETIVIELNGKVGTLLARFAYVPALLKVTLLGTPPPTVFTRNIEIRSGPTLTRRR
jgi:hypothetical protein